MIMEPAFKEEKKEKNIGAKRNVFEAALRQVRWLDDYNGPMVEREVEFFTQPSKAQFVKSFYITSRNFIYLDSCLRSPYESVREASKAEHDRIRAIIQDAVASIEAITKDLQEKARQTGLKGVIRNTGERGIVYVMAPLANIFLDAILKLDEKAFAVDTLWVDRRLSEEERMAIGKRARGILDGVYDASSAAYHHVSDVYHEARDAKGGAHG
jgi:hypothetical protein